MANGSIRGASLGLRGKLFFRISSDFALSSDFGADMKRVMIFVCSLIAWTWAADASKCTSAERTGWLANSLKEIETIQVGMTRQELLRVFRPDGGFFSSTRLKGVYVYRDSPYIKVDVEFTAAEGKASSSGPEDVKDVISSISRPYIAQPHPD